MRSDFARASKFSLFLAVGVNRLRKAAVLAPAAEPCDHALAAPP
jgi:hypothetical protein